MAAQAGLRRTGMRMPALPVALADNARKASIRVAECRVHALVWVYQHHTHQETSMNDTQPQIMMTETQARIFREARDGYVQRISRMSKARLVTEYRSELAAQGQVLLSGGPASKNELVSAIVSLRYPVAKLNESLHVLYHRDGISNDICAYCNPDPCPACGALDTCTWDAEHGPIVNGRHVNV